MDEENAYNPENEVEVTVDDEETEEVVKETEETAENDSSGQLDKSATNLETSVSEKQRLVRLPLARIKNLIKMDPDCGIVSQDSVFLITKATVSETV